METTHRIADPRAADRPCRENAGLSCLGDRFSNPEDKRSCGETYGDGCTASTITGSGRSIGTPLVNLFWIALGGVISEGHA